MPDFGRDADEIHADIAYAIGEGLDVLEYLAQQSRARTPDAAGREPPRGPTGGRC
jgi:hypothetical protein